MVMEELLFIVDQHNKPLEPKPRSEAIVQGLWRRTSGCVIVDEHSKNVLCQRRSDAKDERPGVWVAMFGGKSASNETAAETLARELREELGLSFADENITYYNIVKSSKRKQFEYLYTVRWSGNPADIAFDRHEVSEVAWVDINEAIRLLQSATNWYSYGYDIEMLTLINAQTVSS